MRTFRLDYQGVYLLWSGAFFLLLFVVLTAFFPESREEFLPGLQETLLETTDQWPPELLEFYDERDYRPVWIEEGKLTDNAVSLVNELYKAKLEGLDKYAYLNAPLISRLIKTLSGTLPQSSADFLQLEIELSQIFIEFSRHLLNGRISPDQLHQYWSLENRTIDLKTFLHGLENTDLEELLKSLKPAHKEYDDLKEALAIYWEIESHGDWPQIEENRPLKLGMTDPSVIKLRKRLQLTQDLRQSKNSAQRTIFDRSVEAAVQRFQRRHGLEATGIVDENTRAALNVPVAKRIEQLALNMDRWRWLPDDLGDRHVRINIPDYTLEAFDHDENVLSMKIIVGNPQTPTDLFHAEISQIVVSPYWYVPSNIAKKEILPLLQRDSTYLSRNNMEVRFQGKTIGADSIVWQEYSFDDFPFILRQTPGHHNSLGRLRFTLPNPLDIGIHDTPEKHLFAENKRAFSHGCVRLEHPMDLGIFALNDVSWTIEHLQEIIDFNHEYSIPIESSIPVYFLYPTAWVDKEGIVQFREDVYGHDTRFLEFLTSNDEEIAHPK